jgi:type III secretion system low calcium response chaperone LcrH/SycD
LTSSHDIAQPNADAGKALIDFLMSGQTLAQALGHTVESVETVYYLAYTFYGQAKYEQAMRLFAYLMTTNHIDRRYYCGFAACMQKLKRHEEAIKYYGFASVLDATDPEPPMRCAECFMALGDIAKARQGLDYALTQARAHEEHKHFVPRLEAMLALIDGETAPAGSH